MTQLYMWSMLVLNGILILWLWNISGAIKDITKIQENILIILEDLLKTRKISERKSSENLTVSKDIKIAVSPKKVGPNKGKKLSIEQKKKISDSATKRWANKKSEQSKLIAHPQAQAVAS